MQKKVLIIGSGNMAHEYIKTIAKYFPLFNISLITNSKSRANELQKLFNIDGWHKAIDDVDLSKYQKIIVCTSEKNFYHIAKRLKGFIGEVMFEKPLGLSLDESLKIAEINKKNFFVALNRRFYDGIEELKNFIGNNIPVHGLILDQQSVHDWEPRRLEAINNEMVYSNSVHIIDLTFFILNNVINTNEYKVSALDGSQENVSMYQIQASAKNKFHIDYIRHNDIPGKWQILLFFRNFSVYFENLENFKVLSPTREVLLSSPAYKDDVKAGLKPMLDLFLGDDKAAFSKLPLAIECIEIFKILNNLKA
tara:strand:- start:705 stop:1628 length:924 start_codon:yes stop_codon:yes gene_type:complete